MSDKTLAWVYDDDDNTVRWHSDEECCSSCVEESFDYPDVAIEGCCCCTHHTEHNAKADYWFKIKLNEWIGKKRLEKHTEYKSHDWDVKQAAWPCMEILDELKEFIDE